MDFFLVPAEFLLISVYDNTVKTDSDSTDFCRQFVGPNITDHAGYNRQDWDHDHYRRAYATATAVWPIERPSSRHRFT